MGIRHLLRVVAVGFVATCLLEQAPAWHTEYSAGDFARATYLREEISSATNGWALKLRTAVGFHGDYRMTSGYWVEPAESYYYGSTGGDDICDGFRKFIVVKDPGDCDGATMIWDVYATTAYEAHLNANNRWFLISGLSRHFGKASLQIDGVAQGEAVCECDATLEERADTVSLSAGPYGVSVPIPSENIAHLQGLVPLYKVNSAPARNGAVLGIRGVTKSMSASYNGAFEARGDEVRTSIHNFSLTVH